MTHKLNRFAPVIFLLAVSACGSDGAGAIEEISVPSNLPSGAASGETEADPGTIATSTELCDAVTYRPLIGTNITDAALPEADSLRVFSVNDIVTRDFIPRRTNVVYETNGEITQVFCG